MSNPSWLALSLLAYATAGGATANNLGLMIGTSVGSGVGIVSHSPLIPLLRIVGADYAFLGAPRVAAGLVTIRFVNKGREPHYYKLLRLEDGKTAADFHEMQTMGAAKVSARGVGSPAPLAPGDSSEITLVLTPGSYTAVCMLDNAEGKTHSDMGMFSQLYVDSATTAMAAVPKASVSVRLNEYSFERTGTLRQGWQTLQFRNTGAQTHQAFLMKIPSGGTANVEMALMRKGFFVERGTRSIQGLLELPPGTTAWTRVRLSRGDYILACNAPGPGKIRHLDRGMFEVIHVR